MSNQNTPFQIKDSTVLVTGATRGLGASFVSALIQRGASRIYAGARSTQSIQLMIDKLGPKVVAVELDVTDQDQVNKVASEAGDISLLINNAGVLGSKGLIEAGDIDTLAYEMDVNVYGLARMSLAFAPILASNGGGAILNILSVASLHAFAPMGSYSATKAAAMSLTQSMAYELRDQGTQVFGTYAGYIDTGMINHITGDKASPEAIADASLEGLETGTSDIDADERATAVRALLNEGGPGVREAYWSRADEFKENQG